MRRLLREECGFTVVELLVVGTITVILMAGLSNIFVSSLRTSSNTSAILASQTSVKVALDRLETETRCASQAARLSGGAGVTLTLPGQCSHASGTVTWCVTSGALVRYAGSSTCSGSSSATFASNVTSTTPFSCVATVGDYPQLQVALKVDAGTLSSEAVSATDTITLRNAPVTTSSSAACS